ncbi:energy-coupling factor transport system ATP-binding protein [Paenibacillus forsythiae]|uniref:Energy-coupling factor transport system ATP-binding protein n=1 Tax=Paenibacillus forsythiae TaxID=365616 RepID=A0ABU3HBX6_9BACL|nr:ATP-binding cassette domain-containing protein [Paenibacillus forsythiae]MDT3428313.1 energy-coupling factor transport system ATP-binding protein [Paenibacillus forsythiae]
MNEISGQRHSAERGPDAIALKDVSFGYDPENPVLQGISLRIPQGQWVALVGESGSGKSTLVKLLNALLPKSAGEIAVCGEVLSEASIPSIRRKIGMVFQNPDNQFVGETVEEDMLFGLEGLCLSREEMDRRLQLYSGKLGVSGLLSKHPGELSGGQKQRVAIASILAMEPGVVMFDEASSMLDEESRNGLLGILRDMHAEGYTILMITHDADEIMAAQRVLALSGGGLAGDMTPAELFRSPELMEACRLRAPYAWELGRELETRGLSIGVPASEKELVEMLWPFNCSK